MTISAITWSGLTLEHVQRYLDEADDEPLVWEAKGTRLDPEEIRRQVCAFANGHEIGYLILGAKLTSSADATGWVLDGLEFPDEPPIFISNVIGDLEAGVRPRPDFDVLA